MYPKPNKIKRIALRISNRWSVSFTLIFCWFKVKHTIFFIKLTPFEHNLGIDIVSNQVNNTMERIPEEFAAGKSTLDQLMEWYPQATMLTMISQDIWCHNEFACWLKVAYTYFLYWLLSIITFYLFLERIVLNIYILIVFYFIYSVRTLR